MMLLGVVLPDEYFSKIKKLISEEFPMIQAHYIIYKDYRDAPDLIRERQDDFDAIIFGGCAPYECCTEKLHQKVFWNYIPCSGSTLLCALIGANFKGWDITKLSIDTYSFPMLAEAYNEFGVEEERMQKIRIFSGDRTDRYYIDSSYEFHRRNYLDGVTSGCITALVQVSRKLKDSGIPHMLAAPTYHILREKISEAEQVYRAKKNATGRIAVIFINIDYPTDHPFKVESEYSFMLEKSRIDHQIFRYADQLSASVSISDPRSYIIFTTKEILEAETQIYKEVKLLSWIEKVSFHSVSVGIGNGDNVAAARKNALLALLRAKEIQKNSAYVMLSDGQYIGPIYSLSEIKVPNKEDHRLVMLAKLLDLSTETVCRLHAFAARCQNTTFTTKELASEMGISRRSADRLVEKLELAGKATVEGYHVMGQKGRPSRAIKLKLF